MSVFLCVDAHFLLHPGVELHKPACLGWWHSSFLYACVSFCMCVCVCVCLHQSHLVAWSCKAEPCKSFLFLLTHTQTSLHPVAFTQGRTFQHFHPIVLYTVSQEESNMCCGGLPQSHVQQMEVYRMISRMLLQTFPQHDTLMWVWLGQGQIILRC